MSPTTRRDLFWLASRVFAAPAAAPFLSQWMRAAQAHEHGINPFAPPEPAWTHGADPLFFSKPDFQMVERFTEILIPTDDTPGAREAHVARYIDFVLSSASEYAPEMQRDWKAAVAWLRGQRFGESDAEQQAALVKQMSGPELDRGRNPVGNRAEKNQGFAHFRLIKEMTVFAFYTSRAGLVEALEYKGNAYLKEFPACTHPEHKL